MITDILTKNKTVSTEDDKEAEIRKLQEQISTLKEKAGIDDLAIETEKIRQENEARLQQALEEERKKREIEAERKKKERVEQIQQIFKEQLNKKIRVFRVVPDKQGKRPVFYTELPITCPACGSDDIRTFTETLPIVVKTYEEFQEDPDILLRRPSRSVYSRDHHCIKCRHDFRLHFLITL